MKKVSHRWVIFFLVWTILLAGQPGLAASSKTRQYAGKVVSLYKGTLSVKGDKGEVLYFGVNAKTVYTPNRTPVVGDKVEVKYYFRKGYYVAEEVKFLPTKKQK